MTIFLSFLSLFIDFFAYLPPSLFTSGFIGSFFEVCCSDASNVRAMANMSANFMSGSLRIVFVVHGNYTFRSPGSDFDIHLGKITG